MNLPVRLRAAIDKVRSQRHARLLAPAVIAVLGALLIAVGSFLAVDFARTPAVVLQHPRSPAPIQQAVASLAQRLQAISPYARTHSAPPRPPQPRRGTWIEVPALGIDLPLAQGDGSNRI